MQELEKFIDEKLKHIGKAAIEATVEVIDDESYKVYENIKNSTPVRTGSLKGSLSLERIYENGRYGYRIEFKGYNAKGVAFERIAYALNKGNSIIPGTHFLDKNVRKLKGIDKRIYDHFIEKIDGRGRC